MNPTCPKCGKTMRVRNRTTLSREEGGKKIYGMAKYWICPTRSLPHGFVSFKVGAAVIPTMVVI